MSDIKGIDVEELAKFFHYTYEREAKEVGWKTQEACQVKWEDLPDDNKTVMLRTCLDVIKWINENQEDLGVLHKFEVSEK